ncbi:MAG: TonB family protein [Bacteroidota bacterium]
MKPTSVNNWRQLLRRWISGDSTRREEQQLEKLAGKDSFLAEAFEGYQQLPEGRHEERIGRLRGRLQQQTQPSTPQHYLYRVAAVVSFLVVAGAGLWYVNQGSPEIALQNVATEEMPLAAETMKDFAANSKSAAETPTREEITDDAPAPQPNIATSPLALNEEEKQLAPKPRAKSEKKAEEPAYFADEVTVEPEAAAEVLADEPTIEVVAPPIAEAESAPLTVTSAPATAVAADEEDVVEEAARALKQEPTYQVKELSGTIRDANGEPLIGASVYHPVYNIGTVTDVDGKFNLQINDSIRHLNVAYVGYLTESIDIRNVASDKVEVTMNSSELALSEIQVISYEGTPAKKRAQAQEVKPQKGFKKFRRYIRKNLRYPEAAKAAGIEGDVELRFEINAQGLPTDIQVLRSLGYGCDEEAIRLIKEGGRWESRGGAKEVRYTISFKL